jgi:hypothetical protein
MAYMAILRWVTGDGAVANKILMGAQGVSKEGRREAVERKEWLSLKGMMMGMIGECEAVTVRSDLHQTRKE